MIKIKKILMLLLFIYFCLVLNGCSKNYIPEYIEYNAKLYDDAGEWLNDDFKEQNTIKGKGENCFKVTDEQAYNQIFKNKYDELNIDFNNQMILVINDYTYYIEKDYLYHIICHNSMLNIYVVQQNRNPKKAKEMICKWKVITMDYLDISEDKIFICYY